MRAAALFVLAAAGLVAAQSATASAPSVTVPGVTGATQISGCGPAVDAIINDCLNTENAQLASCAASDWDCMCTQITNVVTCYNNCPTDPNAFSATQRQTSYCNAAKQFGSSSSSVAAPATTSAPVASSAAIAVVAATTSTASGSATPSPTTNAMAHLAAPASGAVVALLGLAVLF